MKDRLTRALPKGSGFNNPWVVESKGDKLVATTNYEVMNENGYYDGYIGIKVTVPTLDVKFFDATFLTIVATNWRGNPTVRKYWTVRDYGNLIYEQVYHSVVKAFNEERIKCWK